jgi:excisionase family DNA binding protein
MAILHRNQEWVTDITGKQTVAYIRITRVHPNGEFAVTVPDHLASAAAKVAAAHDIDYRPAGDVKGVVVADTFEKAELGWKILIYWCKQYLARGETGARSPQEIMTVEDLAKYLRVEQSWVYGQSKHLPHFRVGKHLRFFPNEVVAYLRDKYTRRRA